MKAPITSTAALGALLLLCAARPAHAEGFSLVGDDYDDMKLVFDSTGLSLASPEDTAKSFLRVVLGIRTETALEIKFEKLQVAHTEKLFGGLLTDEAKGQLFGAAKKKIAALEKLAGSSKPPIYEVTRKEEKDGEVTLDYKVQLSQQRPCGSCDEKPNPDCECKGTLVVKRESTEVGRVVVEKDGDHWLVKVHTTECWGCKTKEKDRPSCTTCKGTGFIEDDFIKGPPGTEGKIDTTLPSVDLSTPEAAFDTFAATLRVMRLKERSSESKFMDGFLAFKKFLIVPGAAPEPEKRKIDMKAQIRLEVSKQEDGSVYVTYARPPFEGAPKEEKPQVAGRLRFVKSGDSWKIASVEERCWECSYGGEPAKCEKCNKTGYSKAKSLPY